MNKVNKLTGAFILAAILTVPAACGPHTEKPSPDTSEKTHADLIAEAQEICVDIEPALTAFNHTAQVADVDVKYSGNPAVGANERPACSIQRDGRHQIFVFDPSNARDAFLRPLASDEEQTILESPRRLAPDVS